MEALDADKLDVAIPLLRKALAANPQWAEGWWSLGTALYDQERYAEAGPAFQKVVALKPKQGTARAMLGLCKFELGQPKGSLEDIEMAKTLGVMQNTQLRDVVLYHEGVLRQRAGEFEGAQAALTSLCLSGVRSRELMETFGMVALRMRDEVPPESSTETGQVVLHVGYAACIAGAKQYDAAKAAFEQVLAHAPHFSLLHYAYGRVLIDAHDRVGAVAQFQAEIVEQPKNILPRLRIAAAQYKVDSAAGLKYAEEAVQIEPNMPFAHYLLGLLLFDTGAYDRAVLELETARKAFASDARVYWALASAYAHVGRAQDAAKTRAEAARLFRNKPAQQSDNPDSADALNAPIEMTDSADTPATPAPQ
jgi:predicted Zn-dependent protease